MEWICTISHFHQTPFITCSHMQGGRLDMDRAAISCHKNRNNLCVPDIHLNALKSCFEQLS